MLKSTKENPEIKCIIQKLESGELGVRDIPEEFALDSNVVKAERRLGLRKSGHRGFDVITQMFFVEENWLCKDASENLVSTLHKTIFDSFEEYYRFLDGDIYEDACYYQYTFDDKVLQSLNFDVDRLSKMTCFVTETIDDYACELLQDEFLEYDHCEKINKKCVKQWLKKFNTCDTYEQFQKVCTNYEKSTVAKYKHLQFFLFQYAFDALRQKKHLDVLMEYLSKDYYIGGNVVLGLCLIHTPEIILDKYEFSQASIATNGKRKKEVKNFIKELKNHDVEIKVIGYFDEMTHFYCEETKVYRYDYHQGRKILNQLQSVDVCRAFETFNEFIEYRKGDLKNCDLSGANDLDVDFSKYSMDDTTKLPIREDANLRYNVLKVYKNGEFIVGQFWSNKYNKIIKSREHRFSYFFDFVTFLKGDLSGADLLFCTGMRNLSNIDGINLRDVKMISELCEQFNVSYKTHDYDEKLIGGFPVVEKNEEETALILQESREIASYDNSSPLESFAKIILWKETRISYISDLHLMHRIKNAGCKSKEDVIYTLQKIIDVILAESTNLTLIGGDVSSEFSIFQLFVEMLRKSGGSSHNFVFVLGNHELWDFPDISLEETINKYRTILRENGMYLLHNDLFYKNEYDEMGVIPYAELTQLDNSAIWKKLRCARWVILGGLGFSGYNEEFNANSGIYLKTIDRNIEIQESKKFEQLYNKLKDVLMRKNTVIFTHTPKKDWCEDANYQANFVYVSGHTHRNIFHDDGVERIYADNQVGYRNESIHLKSFLMDSEYDYFCDYEDGIYEITSQEYKDFSRGKNIRMTFNRQVNILYMLKKNGYYCFILKTRTGVLSMLNGGALKKLHVQDVNYYYKNMEVMIASIEAPLRKYETCQEELANEIKRIGGDGYIHGCIIDIDYYNHVYVNPIDMRIRAYWASDIINKFVYPSVPELLQAECPELYANYLKLIEREDFNPLMVRSVKNEVEALPQKYLETDIYKVSREIKKMQKLDANVLTTWYDSVLEQNRLS